MDIIRKQLHATLRRLAQSPKFSLLAIFVLACGIGPNTAIFSIVSAVLLKPLPVRDSERLVMIWESYLQKGFRMLPASGPNYLDWKEQNRVFEDLAAGFMLPEYGFNITAGGEPERVQAVRLTANYLPLAGLRPVLGRTFSPDEDRPGGRHVVLISHGLWMRRFGSDSQIIGRALALDGISHTIIGVTPPEISALGTFDLVLPLALGPEEKRFNHFIGVMGRLKPGASLQQAQVEMNTIAQRLGRQYPDTNEGWGITVTPMTDLVSGMIGPVLLILLGAVGFLLLIACANMASLLLARAATRRRDIAVCMALGAGRGRIVSEFMLESILLALAGGAVGLLFAGWTVGALRAIVPDFIPRLKQMNIDYRVLGFTFVVSIITGVLFGLVPALKSSGTELGEALKEGGRTPGSAGQRTRAALLVGEVALAVILTVGAGLLARSFIRLMGVDPGFRPARLLTMTLNLPASKYSDDAKCEAFYKDLLPKIEALPGAKSAAAINVLPMRGMLLSMRTFVWPFNIEGQLTRRGEEAVADFRVVTAGFFETMSIPIRSGRLPNMFDTRDSKPVVLINEALARRHFHGQDPLGRRINLGVNDPKMREIVGVIGDVRLNGLGTEAEPALYVPYSQYTWKTMSLVVRTGVDPAALTSAIRRAVFEVDPEQPVSNIKTMDDVVSDSLLPQWLSMYLIGSFAGLALLLATVGIYGLTAYTVAQRTHEFGLRMALGARRSDVMRMVLFRGLLLGAAGVAIGLPLAFAVSGVLRGLLYGISPSDPVVFVAVPLVLVLATTGASLVPARRATKVDPIAALHYE
jgi:putative ABC transport system permease protein